MSPCKYSDFPPVSSALPPFFTTIHQRFTPVHVFLRAWKLTLLETRRNPVSDPCSLSELRHQLFTLTAVSTSGLKAVFSLSRCSHTIPTMTPTRKSPSTDTIQSTSHPEQGQVCQHKPKNLREVSRESLP